MYSIRPITISVLIACSLAAFSVTEAVLQGSNLLVIDTDPGVDDAAALMTVLGAMAEEVTVLGITTVRGNARITDVTHNVLKVTKLCNRMEVPVYGAADLNLAENLPFEYWFGEDGFWNISIPNAEYTTVQNTERIHSASFLANTVKERPGQVTILAVGPLTNIALAIHLNPNFLKQAKRIIVLGGSLRGIGNIFPGLEFNFYMDADAASFLLERARTDGVQITLLPLETVIDNDLGKAWRTNVLGRINNVAFNFLNVLERTQELMHPQQYRGVYTPSDVYAAAIVLSRDTVVQTRALYGFVQNRSDNRTRGMLVVDLSNSTGQTPNILVVTDVNVTEIRRLMWTNLRSLPARS